jgi:hypothetical protein
MKQNRLISILTLALAGVALTAPAKEDWVELFNSKNLDGWEQHSGKAKYRVEDGCIVGQTVAGTGNSFLCTKRKFSDFIFEFEFKVAENMNSGVQFRSEVFDQEKQLTIDGKVKIIPADRIHGYQYEIDPSPRAYTAGVYDEARRGWLFELGNHEAARKAFKQGEWNQGRIECRGDSIKTWINGVPAADFKDSMTPNGVFGLQIHAIGKKGVPGNEVRWRNLRVKELK